MSNHDSGHSGYVDKVREETQNYLRKLLAENESLRVVIAQLETDNARLKREVESAQAEISHRESQELRLREKLDTIRAESEQYLQQYAQLEQHNANLANLYVASYQLHGTLDRDAVIGAIQEIIVNLIGSEEFGVFEREPGRDDFTLVASVGVGDGADIETDLGPIGDSLVSGNTFIATAPEPSGLTACVPLKLDGHVTGFIAIYRLLAHKSQFEPLDHELFDLLATHAATALYCTSLHHERIERLTA